ncbi:hypothetical protein [Burkholderia metallica]
MNRIHVLTIAATLVLGGAGRAWAEPCTLSVNDPNVDFGRVFGDRIGAMRGTDRRPVASMNRAIAVQCAQGGTMALRFDGIPSPDGNIRLGNVADYTITVTRVALDGRDVQAGIAPSGAATANAPVPLLFRQGETLVPYDGNRPASGKRLDVFIRIDAFRAAGTALSAETTVTSEPRFSVVPAP